MPVQISSLVDELSVLPEQGSATMQLLRLLDDPDADAKDIVPVIAADPSLTANQLMIFAALAIIAIILGAAGAF